MPQSGMTFAESETPAPPPRRVVGFCIPKKYTGNPYRSSAVDIDPDLWAEPARGTGADSTESESDVLTQSVGSVAPSDSSGSFSSDTANGVATANPRALPSQPLPRLPNKSLVHDDPSKHITALAAAQRSAWPYVDMSASDVRLADCDSETIFRQLYISSDYRAQYGSRCPTPRAMPRVTQRTSPEAESQARAQIRQAEAHARVAVSENGAKVLSPSRPSEQSPNQTTPIRPSGIATSLAVAPLDKRYVEGGAFCNAWDAAHVSSALGSGDILNAYITDTLKRPQGRYTLLEYCIEVEFERASGILCHRYSNFRNLYHALGEKFGFDRLPLFPGKRIHTLTPAVVNRRTEALNAFLEGVIDDDELRCSEDVRTFLSLETVVDPMDCETSDRDANLLSSDNDSGH